MDHVLAKYAAKKAAEFLTESEAEALSDLVSLFEPYAGDDAEEARRRVPLPGYCGNCGYLTSVMFAPARLERVAKAGIRLSQCPRCFSTEIMAGSPPDFAYASNTTEKETNVNPEQEIEEEIQAKGLNAPRLTPDHIDATILTEQYHVFPGTTLTVCCLTLRNGFQVTGESATASPENFDVEIGRKIARDKARNKIWSLEGYLLKQRLFETAATPAPIDASDNQG